MKKINNKKGFTLQELLITIGIIIITLAIAIPAISSLRKNLMIAELDDTARQIYLVTQNKLTTMKATGSLTNFEDELKTNYLERRLSETDMCPQDYDLGDDDWKKLYVLNSNDTILQNYIICDDSILVSSLDQNGHFIIELNPESGDVYGVFYAKKSFVYDEVNFNGLPSRDRSDRKPVMIGYYGGSIGLSAESDYPDDLNPTIEIINKEDLYAKVTCTGVRKLLKTQRYIIATVTLTDEEYNSENATEHIWSTDLRGGTDFWLRNDTFTLYSLFDSIRGDRESFEKITNGKLNPGDNLTVRISITYSYDGITRTGYGEFLNVNSLFGSRDENGNITVHAVRHLNNLRSTIYDAKKGGITITQTAPIDFEVKSTDVGSKNWDSDAIINGKPLANPYADTGLKPISNSTLFNGTTYNGNNNSINHFKITNTSSTSSTGLFEKLNNCTIQNTRIVNIDVDGIKNVGALAGEMNGGSVTSTGVYLTNVDEYDRHLPDMADRVEKYMITARGSNAGGLVGQTSGGVIFKDSFGAINVKASSYAGGLVGYHNDGQIVNCYTSGDITTTSNYAGGIVGFARSAALTDCYSTSDITATGYSAGIVGYANSGLLTRCTAYGRVAKEDDSIDTATSAPICGNKNNVGYSDCKYLMQANYNAGYNPNPSGVQSFGFPELKKGVTNSKANCHPYSTELANAVFPFKMLNDSNNALMDHYGDWPAELKLQTSLVYYEKYATPDADGSYFGYYAETSLTATDSDLDTGGTNNWKVDTLRDETCVEDGYAIMSIYALTSYTYKFNDDIDKNAQLNTIKIRETAGDGLSVRIDNNATLEFTNTKDNSSYTVTGCKIFQLPFSLQLTQRANAARFYNKLTVTGYINGEAKFENYTFFYCPDFAKNAINPDISVKDAQCPADPTGENDPVYVRSARQLNALGRAPYYWNTKNGGTYFYFMQETDINFGTYVKTYCGKYFNLMDTSEDFDYRNQPIGRPQALKVSGPSGTFVPSNFRYTYDGQNNVIIDYCCITYEDDNFQFTGLFGEVQEATLKNIHMVASDPDNNTGYVKSYYRTHTWDNKHSGVGAMVGLLYVECETDANFEYDDKAPYNHTYATMYNCSVSGYTVMQGNVQSNRPSNSYAVGGLVGHCFGKIENCSAVSKVVKADTDTSYRCNEKYVGGIVGSLNGRGSIINSYAGGELAVANGNGTAYVGGIAGGFDNIYGAYWSGNEKNREQKILQSYSYCTMNKANLNGYVQAYAISCFSTLTVQDCYYLKNTIINQTLQTPWPNNCKGFKACDYYDLTEVTLPKTGNAAASGNASASNTHPWSDDLKGRNYPFPAVIRDYDPKTKKYGDYVHYGDWYAEANPLPSGYIAYYEKYADGTYFYNYMNDEQKMVSVGTMDTTNSKRISSAGYGLFHLAGDTHKISLNGFEVSDGDEILTNIKIGKGSYNLYKLSDAAVNYIKPIGTNIYSSVRVDYNIVDYNFASSRSVSLYINPYFANAISDKVLTNSSTSPFQVRTAEQLQNMSNAPEKLYIKVTHNIKADSTTGNIDNKGYHFDGGYSAGGSGAQYGSYTIGNNGNYIIGLTKPLFNTIASGGTVTNTAIIDADVEGSKVSTAPLAVTNYGTISNCFTEGSVTTYGEVFASGFVALNGGTITASYANCNVTSDYGFASGFTRSNTGTISNCYVAGKVNSAEATGAGFAGVNDRNGSIRNCYTIAEINAKTAYGFAPPNNSIAANSCYWAYSATGINYTVTGSSAGTKLSLREMKSINNLSGSWTKSNAGHTWPKDGDVDDSYPYPRISSLDHCGDWAKSLDSGKIGVIKYYTKGGSYSGSGVCVDSTDGKVTTYTKDTNGYNTSYPASIAILCDDDIHKNLSDWTIEITYKRGGTKEETKEVPWGDISKSLTVENIPGLYVIDISNTFPVQTVTIDSLTIKNEKYNASYTFKYVNNDATYASTFVYEGN